ncbi:pentapeptide repeat-containing protein [Streptomyces althioticus]|uniref:pentapeptide repeat-containing protein n=1 Tax=Streptomyces althioticus TaxID=83380 RepID=UPI0036BF8A22
MWDVRLVLALAFVAALAVAALLFYLGWGALGVHKVKQEKTIDASTLFDLVKLAFGVVAGAGALVALIVAYRRQRIDEDGALREHTRLHTERFTTAVSQLGDDSPAVKLGGVHALAGLADDAPTLELRQTCIDVLCAFLRLPYTAEPDLPPDDETARHDYLALREVRHTVIRLIRDHLRLPDDEPRSWRGIDLDFTGVVFDGGDFTRSVFKNSRVIFTDATFLSGRVGFQSVECENCIVDFDRARFRGAEVEFSHLRLGYDAWMSFEAAVFSDGVASFRGAHVSETAKLSLNSASCNGGFVFFPSVVIDGGLDLRNIRVSNSQVHFDGAHFKGDLRCEGATFGSANGPHTVVSFDETVFEGCFADLSAYCGPGVVQWQDCLYSGGLISFENASGEPPAGLITPGEPLPEELVVPPAWQASTS